MSILDALDRDFLYFETYKAYADIAFKAVQDHDVSLKAIRSHKNSLGAEMWAMEIDVSKLANEDAIQKFCSLIESGNERADHYYTASEFYSLDAEDIDLETNASFIKAWNEAKPACPKCGTGESCDIPVADMS